MNSREHRTIIVRDSGLVLLENARWCDTFASILRGFTFRKELHPGEGLVIVGDKDGRLASSITMFFVPFDLGVFWVNGENRVVDKKLARPWRPAYFPAAPARYTIEAAPSILDVIQIGQTIDFLQESSA